MTPSATRAALTRSTCSDCGRPVEVHRWDNYYTEMLDTRMRHIPALMILDPGENERGDVIVRAPGQLDLVGDPARLWAEGVPLRMNHLRTCPERPKPVKRRRVMTRNGWRMK